MEHIESKHLDAEAVQDLGKKLMRVMVDHYYTRPVGKEAVLEVLNALGWCVGSVLSGTDEAAMLFFHRTVTQTMLDMPAISRTEASKS